MTVGTALKDRQDCARIHVVDHVVVIL
jgi:hypothetical protein